jgi:hypothetical protein
MRYGGIRCKGDRGVRQRRMKLKKEETRARDSG